MHATGLPTRFSYGTGAASGEMDPSLAMLAMPCVRNARDSASRARGQAERDGVAHFDVKRIDRFDVHQRANGIFGLHAARENGVRGQSYEAHARKRNQKHRRCCN